MAALRYYQAAAVAAVWKHLREKETNPCVVMPTGSGKSWVIGQIASDAVANWGGRVLCIAHVKELLEQNAGKIKAICPDIPLGIYSAGLGRSDTRQSIIVGGIQSVYSKAEQLGRFDLVVIDEVHMCPADGEGMYRTLLGDLKAANPSLRVVGLTATPWRMKGGLICKPENILNEVCYEIGLKEMIGRGFLSKLVSKSGRALADLDHLHVRGGEFVQEDVDRAMGDEEIVTSACGEIARLTRDRKSVILFCTSVAHANRVSELIARYAGQECAVVTGDTPAGERAEILARFRMEKVDADLFGNGKPPLKYVANVECLTTGFDAPGIDTVCLLRPTMSPGLLMQMCGRGTRLSSETGKTDCLILDYGRNIERHGPLDALNPPSERRSAGQSGPLAKTCPQCRALLPIRLPRCPECGYEYPKKEPEPKFDSTASNLGVLSGETVREEHDVRSVDYNVWQKRGAPPEAPHTVRVSYRLDLLHSISEWLCPEHTGYARRKFETWWREHAVPDCPMPVTAEDVCEYANMGMIREVKKIKVRAVAGEKYPNVVGYELGDAPVQAKQAESESLDDGDLPF
jgi:DNA repair protein RadD